MKTRLVTLCVLAVMIGVAPALAQQGEGNMRDLFLNTAINGGPLGNTDRPVLPGDVITVELTSGSLSGGIALGGDIAPVSFDFELLPGVLGIGLGANRFLLVNSITSFGPQMTNGVVTINLAIPCSPAWEQTAFTNATDIGLWLQAAMLDPALLPPNGPSFAVTETIKHEVQQNVVGQWANSKECALQAGGFSDADLGTSLQVDTTAGFNDNYDIDDLAMAGGGTTTNFILVGPGQGTATGSGTSPDALAAFTAGQGGAYTFDLCNSNYDTRIFIVDDACNGIVANDDDPSCPGFQSVATACLTPGQLVFMIADGWRGDAGLADIVITRQAFGVSGISPPLGAETGGDTVTITGDCMDTITSVTFDGIPATNVTVVDQNTVTCVTPMHAPGVVDVAVSDGVETETLAGAFLYIAVGMNTTTILSSGNGGTMTDDGFEEVFLLGTLNFCGNSFTSVFVSANGQIALAAGDTDFSPSLGEFFAGFQSAPTSMGAANPGATALWGDYNRDGNSLGDWTVIEDTIAGTLEVQVNNQEFWDSQTAMGSTSVTFDTATGSVSMDLSGIVSTGVSGTDQNPIIGVTDGDDQIGTDTVIDFATMLPYTSPGANDSVAQQLNAGDPVPATSITFTENGTCNWSIM